MRAFMYRSLFAVATTLAGVGSLTACGSADAGTSRSAVHRDAGFAADGSGFSLGGAPIAQPVGASSRPSVLPKVGAGVLVDEDAGADTEAAARVHDEAGAKAAFMVFWSKVAAAASDPGQARVAMAFFADQCSACDALGAETATSFGRSAGQQAGVSLSNIRYHAADGNSMTVSYTRSTPGSAPADENQASGGARDEVMELTWQDGLWLVADVRRG